jgi:GTP-binding protein Era
MNQANLEPFRCGFIALVGRPNVGKSTLLNRLIGHKASIVTPKPQTTRERILGVRTTSQSQMIFLDTPGLHRRAPHAINRMMNRAARRALAEADILLWLVEAGRWSEADDFVLAALEHSEMTLGLVVNKIDRIKPRTALLPYLDAVEKRRTFDFIVPLAAKSGENVASLIETIEQRLPSGAAMFPATQWTDRGPKHHVAETIREKLTLHLQQELPYAVAVEIEQLTETDTLTRIAAIVWVERESQKAIVIGKGGQRLKTIARAARLEIERALGHKVFLAIRVKVRENWTDDARSLQALGLES